MSALAAPVQAGANAPSNNPNDEAAATNTARHYRKRVSFNNLFTDIIDPDKPRYLPKFIVRDEDAAPVANRAPPKNHIADLDFGYTVRRTSSVSHNDPSKFFKFNEFNYVNQNDRFYNDLQSQKSFTEATAHRQKLKREKLPEVPKGRSILKKARAYSAPTASQSAAFGSLHDNSSTRNSHNNSSNTAYHSYNNANPDSFSNVYNRFKSEDQDEETFRNTQLNINLDPDLIADTMAADSTPPSASKHKKLTEMTDEEILALDGQYKLHRNQSLSADKIKSDFLSGLESSIELSKFKVLANNLSSNGNTGSDNIKTQYSKEGVNITNIFNKNYPSRPQVNYRSFVLHSQHYSFEHCVYHNARFTYAPKDVMQQIMGKPSRYNALGQYHLVQSKDDLKGLDPAITPNKTIMAYISGRRHTWNSLGYIFDNNGLIRNGDKLVVFTVLPHDFEYIQQLLNISNPVNEATILEDAEADSNKLVRYKTTSMLDDLNSYNLRKSKSNNSSNLAPPAPSHSAAKSPSSRKGSNSLLGEELKRMNSYTAPSVSKKPSSPPKASSTSSPSPSSSSSSNLSNNNHSRPKTYRTASKRTGLTASEKVKVVCANIQERAKKLLQTLEKMAQSRNLAISITVEFCFDNILHDDLDNNESDGENVNLHSLTTEHAKEKPRRKSVLSDDYLDYSPYSDKSNYDSFSRTTSNDIPELLRTTGNAGHTHQQIRQIPYKPRRRKQFVKADLKFVLTNIIQVYGPQIFVIGSKRDDEYLQGGTNQHYNHHVSSSGHSGRSSALSSRRPSLGDLDESPFKVSNGTGNAATTTTANTTTSTSPSNNSSTADLLNGRSPSLVNNNRVSRVSSNDSYHSGGLHNGTYHSNNNSAHNLQHTSSHNKYAAVASALSNSAKLKMRLLEFLIRDTNLDVLVVPSSIVSKKYYSGTSNSTSSNTISENYNWVKDWTGDENEAADFSETDDEEYDDDDDEYENKDVQSGVAETTIGGATDKLGEMLDNLKDKVSNDGNRVVSSTANNANDHINATSLGVAAGTLDLFKTLTGQKNTTEESAEKFYCPESFFSDLLAKSTDKSTNESLNFLQNSHFDYHDKTLPPTTRTKKILLKHLNNELSEKKIGARQNAVASTSSLSSDGGATPINGPKATTLGNRAKNGKHNYENTSESSSEADSGMDAADDDYGGDSSDSETDTDSESDNEDLDRLYCPKPHRHHHHHHHHHNGRHHAKNNMSAKRGLRDGNFGNMNTDNIASGAYGAGNISNQRDGSAGGAKIQFADTASPSGMSNGAYHNNNNANNFKLGKTSTNTSAAESAKSKGLTYREVLQKAQSSTLAPTESQNSTSRNVSRSSTRKLTNFFSNGSSNNSATYNNGAMSLSLSASNDADADADALNNRKGSKGFITGKGGAFHALSGEKHGGDKRKKKAGGTFFKKLFKR